MDEFIKEEIFPIGEENTTYAQYKSEAKRS